MDLKQFSQTEIGPLWFVTFAVIVVLVTTWSATVDGGVTVPLVWVISPLALSMMAIGLSVYTLTRKRGDRTRTSQDGSTKSADTADDRPAAQENTDGSSNTEWPQESTNDNSSTTDQSDNPEPDAGESDIRETADEVDLTEFSNAKRG